MFSVRIHWKKALLFVLGTLVAAGIGSLLAGKFGFDGLTKPPLTPPEWAFPVVWSVLYILMGVAAYLVWDTRRDEVPGLLRLYILQLAVNVLWPFFFFRLEWRLFAFFWLLLLIALVATTAAGFRRVSQPAALLLLPYLAWSVFAGYLNLGFYLLNR